MATIYRCDRCRHESDEPLGKLHVPKVEYSYTHKQHPNEDVDLCGKCMGAVHDLVKPLPQAAPKEERS